MGERAYFKGNGREGRGDQKGGEGIIEFIFFNTGMSLSVIVLRSW